MMRYLAVSLLVAAHFVNVAFCQPLCEPEVSTGKCVVSRAAGSISSTSLDGVALLAAGFSSPKSVALSQDGKLAYVIDGGNHAVRVANFSSGTLMKAVPTTLSLLI
jgi:DNA-binding beta-propeller fold protein YncE